MSDNGHAKDKEKADWSWSDLAVDEESAEITNFIMLTELSHQSKNQHINLYSFRTYLYKVTKPPPVRCSIRSLS